MGMIIRSAGNLHWKSGYDYLLQSFKLLKDRNIIFQAEIIGSGPLFSELNFSIEDLGLDDFVCILEDNEESVRRKIPEADVFVISAVAGDGRSISFIQEALRMQVPVVSSNFEGAQLVVDMNVKGQLIPMRDPSAMAEGILAYYYKK